MLKASQEGTEEWGFGSFARTSQRVLVLVQPLKGTTAEKPPWGPAL